MEPRVQADSCRTKLAPPIPNPTTNCNSRTDVNIKDVGFGLIGSFASGILNLI